MRKALFVLLLTLSAAMLCASGFDIVRADFEISVSEGRVYTITETLSYDFHQPSHGVIRYIPLDGAKADVIHVSESWQSTVEDGFLVIRIGDPSRLVDGVHDYTITYSLSPGRDGYQDYDEVYLDLYSTYDEGVDNITFSIAMPSDISGCPFWVTYGPYGSSARVDAAMVDDRIIAGRLDHLSPGEGLTLRVELPEGYFAFSDHSTAAFAAVLVISIVLVAVLLVMYLRHGRDEDPVIVPTFSPPDELTPLEVGYLFDSNDDGRDYAAMVWYWADKGLLGVEEKEDGSFTLHRKGRPADGCEEYEKSLFDALFSSGDDVELSSVRLHQAIESSVRPALRRRYAKGERALYDARSQRLQTLAMALTLVYAIAMAFLTAVNDSRFGLFSFFVLAFQMIFSCLVFWSLNRRIPSTRQYVMYSFLVILVTGMGMVFLNGICISAGISRALVHAMTVVMSVALSVMCALAAAMKRRSAYAQEILGRILGYRDFLENVEMDRLRTLIDEDPQYFYHNLSYAIVLSLEQEWANKASSIAVEDASWYVGPSPVTSYVFYYALADRFAHEFGSTCLVPERVSSSPFHGVSSSHGGFSGFSGGGIGGGGSRSW